MLTLRLLSIVSLLLFTLGFSACISDEGPPRKVHLRLDADSDVLGFQPGDRLDIALAKREALLVILDGLWPANGERTVEIDRVIDAGVTVNTGPDEGDPHWITRSAVLDADGEVLWSQRINSLFQLLEFLNLLLQQQDGFNLNARQVYQLVQNQYPELIQFAVKVPTGIEGGVTYQIEITDGQGNWTEIASFTIADLLTMAQPPRIEAEVAALVDNGPDHDRINVAILGDGYTASERVAFERDAQAVAERFMTTSPMAEHADLFNIKSVWTPSNESGAGYDCNHSAAPSGCEDKFRDTIFETVFVIPAVMDVFGMPLDEISDRVAMPVQIGKVFEVASLANYDEIILLSNSTKHSGFAGLYIALATAFDNGTRFPDVAVHEVGHTLGLLGDEYMAPGDPCFFNEPRVPLPANIGEIIDGDIKWSEWLTEDAPLPTPNAEAAQYPVGAYQGAYNCEFLVRPSHTCMMRTSGHEFCPICAEQMVRRFYAFVEPVPAEDIAVVRLSELEARLRIPLRRDEDRYQVNWTVDGVPLDQQVAALRLDSRSLPQVPSGQWVPLEVTVRNNSSFIHSADNTLESHFRFELMLEDLP